MSRIGAGSAGAFRPMATTPLGEDNYPDPLVASPRGGAGLWRVATLGLVIIGAAAGFALFGDRLPPEVVMIFVGLLAVAGVFFLFGLAAGLFRFAAAEERR